MANLERIVIEKTSFPNAGSPPVELKTKASLIDLSDRPNSQVVLYFDEQEKCWKFTVISPKPFAN